MASSNDSIYVNIIANTENAVKGLGKFIAGIVSVTAAMALLKKAVQFSVEQFLQQERADARLVAALRITGQQSAKTVASLKDLASSLQSVTGFADDATEEAAGLLIQLGGLTEQGVKKAIPLLQDFSSLMGMDLAQAAELFGKTLGSSTNALTRYGIELAEGLSPAAKFSSIMEQLQTRAGGFAKEIHDMTYGGTLADLKNAIGDLAEESGRVITQVFAPVAKWLTTQISKIQKVVADTLQVHEIMSKHSRGETLNPYEMNKLAEAQVKVFEAKIKGINLSEKLSLGLWSKKVKAEVAASMAAAELELSVWKDWIRDSAAAIKKAEAGDIGKPDIIAGYAAGSSKEDIISDRIKAASEWISDDQRAYNQDIENGAASMDSYNAAMYILEQRALDAAEAQEKLNAAVKKMTDLMEAETAVENPSWAQEGQSPEDAALALEDALLRAGYAAEKVAEAVAKIKQELKESAALDIFKDMASQATQIAEAIGVMAATGDIASGLKSIAQQLTGLIVKYALMAAASAAARPLGVGIPEAIFWLGIAGVAGFTGGAIGAGGAGGGDGVGMPFPRMAAGGIVTRPTLALIGESGPEAVVPLGRGGGGTTIIVQGSIWQTEDLARAVAGAQARW